MIIPALIRALSTVEILTVAGRPVVKPLQAPVRQSAGPLRIDAVAFGC